MKSAMSQTSSRLLQLLSMLQARRDWPGNELSRRLEVSGFAYRSRDETDSRREVEPHSVVNFGRRWYLVAWDRGRDDWRTFRIDRLTKPASTGVRFHPRKLPAKDAVAYIEQSITSAPNRFEARVTLRAPAEDVAGRVPSYWGSVKPVDDNSCEYRTSDDDLHWLAVRIAMLGVDFEVHEPPELAEHLRVLAARLDRAAG
jgi:predicted DNA-binding transcriptional regulator YafY